MDKAAWKVVKQRIIDHDLSLCGYCRRPYSSRSLVPVGTVLTDRQYDEIESHGICRLCKLRMMEQEKTEASL